MAWSLKGSDINTMKTIQKREATVFNNINLGTGKAPVMRSATAMVRINRPEIVDLAEWFGTPLDEDGEYIFPEGFNNHRANVEHLLAQQDLQHEGSGEVKKQCKKFLQGVITREALDKYVYERDWSLPVGERSYTAATAESMVAKLVGKGLSAEQILALVNKVKADAAKKEEETEDDESEDEEEETNE